MRREVSAVFFDDLNEFSFDHSFAFMRSVGDHFIKAYRPIVARRKSAYMARSSVSFNVIAEGDTLEFNLVYDRGTLFGLQSGGRTESILMSCRQKRTGIMIGTEPNTQKLSYTNTI